MSRRDDRLREVVRGLHGEAGGAAPGEDAAARLLDRTWRELEDPGPLGTPPGFVGSVQARIRAERAQALGAAPLWVRGLAAGALAAGLVLGVGLGRSVAATDSAGAEASWVAGTTLAESWIDTFDGTEEGS